mgnify:CR=1 FL=1
MKIVAKRATEPEYFLMIAHLKIQQIDNNLIDGDVITQSAEKIGRVILWHFGSPMAEEIQPSFGLPTLQ